MVTCEWKELREDYWGGNPDDRRSTSGYCIYLGSCLIFWTAKKQSVMVRRKLFGNSSGLWFGVRGREDWIRIGSWLVVTFLGRKSWFLLARFVGRQIIRPLIITTAWIFLIKAGILLLSEQQWQLILKRNRDLNSHSILTVVQIITSLLNSRI